jgi:hypothetical protein
MNSKKNFPLNWLGSHVHIIAGWVEGDDGVKFSLLGWNYSTMGIEGIELKQTVCR